MVILPAVEGLDIEGTVPVVVEPGGFTASASPHAPARFRQVKPGQRLSVAVGAPFRAEPVDVTIGADGRAVVELRVVPVAPGHPDARSNPTDSEHDSFEVDLTTPWPVFGWHAGEVVKTREIAPSPPSELPRAVERTWKEYGGHMKPSDDNRDPARILVLPSTELAQVVLWASALMSVRRDFASGDALVSKPAMKLTIQQVEPLQPKKLAELVAQVEPLDKPSTDDIRVAGESAGAVNALGLRLYAALARRPGNVVLSPVDVMTCLAVLRRGASGTTAAQIDGFAETASRPGLFREDMASLVKTLRVFRNLRMNSTLFVRDPTPIRAEFRVPVEKDLHASISSVDLTSRDRAAKSINDFVAVQTWDNVTNPVQSTDWPADIRTVVVGTVHMRASWRNGFDARKTTQAAFHLSPTSQSRVAQMHMTEQLVVQRGKGYTVVNLGHSYRTRKSMLVILPDKGQFASVEKRFGQVVEDYDRRPKSHTTVSLTLPRFEVQSAMSLTEALRALGMTDAFDATKADFSGLTSSPGVAVGDFVHAAVLGVYEGGAGFQQRGSRPDHSEPKEIVFDRPFLFAVQDQETKAIVLMGRVVNPASPATDPTEP